MRFLQFYFLLLTFTFTYLRGHSTVTESLNTTSVVYQTNATHEPTSKNYSLPTFLPIMTSRADENVTFVESNYTLTDWRRRSRGLFPLYTKIKNHESSTFICKSLITPILTGKIKLTSNPQKYLYKDSYIYTRLMQLLSLEMVGHDAEEIHSILFQISRLKIRLYMWGYDTMYALLEKIADKDRLNKGITFKDIKSGIKKLIQDWRLNISNETHLLIQARMFRPPCLNTKPHEGSTKRPFGVTPKEYVLQMTKNCNYDILDEEEGSLVKDSGGNGYENNCSDFVCKGKNCGKALRISDVIENPSKETYKSELSQETT